MGNIQESANFIRDHGDSSAMSHVNRKRSDKMYFKSTQNIKLLAVGLCSSISEKAIANLTISETFSGNVLISQNIELAQNKSSQNKYYDLKSPVELLKEKYYTVEVEVNGGATYTYLDSRDSSTHNYCVIELTREVPSKPLPGIRKKIATSGKGAVAASPSSNTSKSATAEPGSRSKTPKLDVKHSFSTIDTVSSLESTGKTPLLQPTTLERASSSKKAQNKKKAAESDSTSLTRSRSQHGEGHGVYWKERVTEMNLITGMLFERKTLSVGCC